MENRFSTSERSMLIARPQEKRDQDEDYGFYDWKDQDDHVFKQTLLTFRKDVFNSIRDSSKIIVMTIRLEKFDRMLSRKVVVLVCCYKSSWMEAKNFTPHVSFSVLLHLFLRLLFICTHYFLAWQGSRSIASAIFHWSLEMVADCHHFCSRSFH